MSKATQDVDVRETAVWQEFRTMDRDECVSALAFLAGRDPELFARVMGLTRGERERRRAEAAS